MSIRCGAAPKPCPIVAPDVKFPVKCIIENPDVVFAEVPVVFIEPAVFAEPEPFAFQHQVVH